MNIRPSDIAAAKLLIRLSEQDGRNAPDWAYERAGVEKKEIPVKQSRPRNEWDWDEFFITFFMSIFVLLVTAVLVFLGFLLVYYSVINTTVALIAISGLLVLGIIVWFSYWKVRYYRAKENQTEKQRWY